MKRVLLLLSMTVAVTALQAQDSMVYRPRYLRTSLWTAQHRIAEGYLYAVSDTALLLSREKCRPNLYDTLTTHRNMQSFDYRDLKLVGIRGRRSTGHSIWVGLLIGAGSGALIGYLSGDSKSAPEPILFGEYTFTITAGAKAAALGFVGGVTGTIVGLIVGVATHRTFRINGKKERLNLMSQKLAMRIGLSNPE